MRTRLEYTIRRYQLSVAKIAALAGYSRQQLLRLRAGTQAASRRSRQSILSAMQALAPDLLASDVFEDLLAERGAERLRKHASVADRVDEKLLRHLTREGATEAHVRVALDLAEPLLDQAPDRAVTFFRGASRVATVLRDDTPQALRLSLLGHAARGEANGLRMLGQYAEALDILTDAQQYFLDAEHCSPELGRVQHSRALILFKMEAWADAAQAAAQARQLFEASRDFRRGAYARLVLGCTAVERGELDSGRRTFIELERLFAGRGDKKTLARVWLNLAICDLRRGDTETAIAWLHRAAEGFAAAKMTTEMPRLSWCRGKIADAEGDRLTAIRLLQQAAEEFANLGMRLDAAFASLDILELLLVDHDPRAEALARALVSMFTSAGVSGSAAQAAAHLRDAVIARTATADVVEAVRRFIRRSDAFPSDTFVGEPVREPFR